MRTYARTTTWAATVVVAIVLGTTGPAGAAPGFQTAEPPYVTLAPTAPPGSSVFPIISSGDTLNDFEFEGIPDGIGIAPHGDRKLDVFVTHEQSRVPFLGQADFVDSSVSRLVLDRSSALVRDADVALSDAVGLIRFCSATMAGPDQGFSRYTFFANEESNDLLDVPAGAPYGPDPSIAPKRQAGYSVYLDAANGHFAVIPGMGRHNHENTMPVPGGWDELALISGDDTFSAPASQLYLYTAEDDTAVRNDQGELWAFRVTAVNGVSVDPTDPFNGANDYGDLQVGETFSGEFIPVPDDVANGTTAATPQDGLENWSNANNVFQFIRIEDTAYDPNQPRRVFLADTGERRALDDNLVSGRLRRGPSGSSGPYPNGRVFEMTFNAADPTQVDSLRILLDNDAGGYNNPAVMHQPDNMGTSTEGLIVQEDSSQPPNSRVWFYDFLAGTWTVMASVNKPAWESSGIVDASAWFGPGSWLLDVQGHGDFVDQEQQGSVLVKREAGQLLLMRVPGT